MAVLLKNTSSFNTVLQNIVKNFTSLYVNNVSFARKFSANVVPSLPSSEDLEEESLETQRKEKALDVKRNVSRLNVYHRNILQGQVPYPEPKADVHLTVKYRRKMYGKYGSSSGVNPGIMWPTKDEIKEREEYERVAYPFTIQEMVREELSKKEAEEVEISERQKKIAENLTKLDKWIDDMEGRRAKKIRVAAEARAKNERVVEEVRRHFGYTVDHRDERFQQMLEQKLKEEKKSAKLERKKKRDEMMMQDLMSQTQTNEGK